MKETFEEFLRRLHCSHVSFEDVAKDLFEAEKENDRLKAAIREAIESEDSAWVDDHLLEALESAG